VLICGGRGRSGFVGAFDFAEGLIDAGDGAFGGGDGLTHGLAAEFVSAGQVGVGLGLIKKLLFDAEVLGHELVAQKKGAFAG